MSKPSDASEQTERAVGRMVVSIVAALLTGASAVWSAITYEGLRRLLHGPGASPMRLTSLAVAILAPAIFAGAIVSILPLPTKTKRILGLPPFVPPILLFAGAVLAARLFQP